METATRTLIATHSGLRGRPGADLDRAVKSALAGLLELIADRGKAETLAVGRDERPSGVELASRVTELATAWGMRVVDLGVTSTPATKLAAREAGLGGAVMVTGSHLGPEWNGLKLFAAPDFWPTDAGLLLQKGTGAETLAGVEGPGEVLCDRVAAERHAGAVCATVDAETIRAAELSVGLRGGPGPAGRLALERLGCAFSQGGSDLTLLFDADGDRLHLADERGHAVDPEATLPLVAIARRARKVVRGADTSRMVELMAQPRGWEVSTTPPGELHLLRRLSEWGADVAGEGNGGAVVADAGMARDALAAGVAVLDLVARSRSSLSDLVAELPALARRRSTLRCEHGDAAETAVHELADRLRTDLDPDLGVLIERADGWALVRPSATEPLLRVTVEASSEAVAAALHQEVRAALRVPDL